MSQGAAAAAAANPGSRAGGVVVRARKAAYRSTVSPEHKLSRAVSTDDAIIHAALTMRQWLARRDTILIISPAANSK